MSSALKPVLPSSGGQNSAGSNTNMSNVQNAGGNKNMPHPSGGPHMTHGQQAAYNSQGHAMGANISMAHQHQQAMAAHQQSLQGMQALAGLQGMHYNTNKQMNHTTNMGMSAVNMTPVNMVQDRTANMSQQMSHMGSNANQQPVIPQSQPLPATANPQQNQNQSDTTQILHMLQNTIANVKANQTPVQQQPQQQQMPIPTSTQQLSTALPVPHVPPQTAIQQQPQPQQQTQQNNTATPPAPQQQQQTTSSTQPHMSQQAAVPTQNSVVQQQSSSSQQNFSKTDQSAVTSVAQTPGAGQQKGPQANGTIEAAAKTGEEATTADVKQVSANENSEVNEATASSSQSETAQPSTEPPVAKTPSPTKPETSNAAPTPAPPPAATQSSPVTPAPQPTTPSKSSETTSVSSTSSPNVSTSQTTSPSTNTTSSAVSSTSSITPQKVKSPLRLATTPRAALKRKLDVKAQKVDKNESPSPKVAKTEKVKAAGSKSGESSEDQKSSKRVRVKTQPFQCPLPELTRITMLSANQTKQSPNLDDKLIVFYKNEFIAVRNAEGGFYVCQVVQNVYKTSTRIRIRWLSSPDNGKNIYSPDFYDFTEFDCILTNLSLERVDKGKYRLPKSELERTENILKRALDVEKGVSTSEVTEEHPDGLDLSLYKDESQLKKRRSSKSSSKSASKKRKSSKTGSDSDNDYKPSKKITVPPKAKKSSSNKVKKNSSPKVTKTSVLKVKRNLPVEPVAAKKVAPKPTTSKYKKPTPVEVKSTRQGRVSLRNVVTKSVSKEPVAVSTKKPTTPDSSSSSGGSTRARRGVQPRASRSVGGRRYS